MEDDEAKPADVQADVPPEPGEPAPAAAEESQEPPESRATNDEAKPADVQAGADAIADEGKAAPAAPEEELVTNDGKNPPWLVGPNRSPPRVVNGVDTWADGSLPPKVPATPEEILRREERRKVAEEKLAYSASVVFADMDWYYDNVLSWIGYRDPRLIERGFLEIHKGGIPEVEPKPRHILRLALQRGEIVAIRRKGDLVERVNKDEWIKVTRTTPLSKWLKDIIFNSDEVKALWKPIPAIGEAASAESSEGEAPAVEPKHVHGQKGTQNRVGITRQIIREQVAIHGRGDLDVLLQAVRDKQIEKGITKLCTKRVLKENLKAIT